MLSDDEPMVSVEKEKEEAQNGLPSSPIKVIINSIC